MKIIVAVDGTRNSEAAVDCLIGMNLAPDTHIKLLTVLKADETGIRLTEAEAGAHNLLTGAKKALDEMILELQRLIEGCVFSAEVVQGEPKSKIVEIAKKWNSDLIVMGSRGHKGMDLILLGSVSQGILMQAPCPVLIVKADESVKIESFRNGFKRIMFTADNSVYSKAAFEWLKKLRFANVEFRLITVIPPVTDSISGEEQARSVSDLLSKHDELRARADMELQILANELDDSFPGSSIVTEVAEGDPREMILNSAETWSADLIVMGSHGRSGLTKLLLGSVSQAVAVHSHCAVAVVRGIAQKGRDEMKLTGRFA